MEMAQPANRIAVRRGVRVRNLTEQYALILRRQLSLAAGLLDSYSHNKTCVLSFYIYVIYWNKGCGRATHTARGAKHTLSRTYS